MARFWLIILTAMAGFCAAAKAVAAPSPRYIAVFADGARNEGKTLSNRDAFGVFSRKSQPKEGSTIDPKRPLRWLRDTTLGAWSPSEYFQEYIEFYGGDRLPGKIIGFVPSRSTDSNCSFAMFLDPGRSVRCLPKRSDHVAPARRTTKAPTMRRFRG